MNTKQKGRLSVVGVVFIMLAGISSINSEIFSRNGLTKDELSTIIKQTNIAFDKAEKTILKIDPVPDNEPNGPHPDADKCVCKGTGKITHGDGHQTDCPYHGEKVNKEDCTGCKCDTKNTYCNCIEAYGKCSCRKTKGTFGFLGLFNNR